MEVLFKDLTGLLQATEYRERDHILQASLLISRSVWGVKLLTPCAV